MGGGELILASYGTASMLIYGNPTASMFKATYKKITKFSMQKFRIDCTDNTNNLRFTEPTTLEFKIDRNGDMLYDTKRGNPE